MIAGKLKSVKYYTLLPYYLSTPRYLVSYKNLNFVQVSTEKFCLFLFFMKKIIFNTFNKIMYIII